MVAAGALTTTAVGGYLWWENRSNTEPVQVSQQQSFPSAVRGAVQPSPTTQTLQVRDASNTPAGSDEGSPQGQAQTNAGEQPSLGTQLGGPYASDAARAESQATLPTPDQFAQYEQYEEAGQLLYAEVNPGNGEQAVVGRQVAMLYKGWLTDGTLFDQTATDEAGVVQPFVFTLGAGHVIQGWDQGIVGMKVGSKRRLVIPSNLAYGDIERGPIPAQSMLIFDIELVAVAPE